LVHIVQLVCRPSEEQYMDIDSAKPRFTIGDQIILVSPGFHSGQQGNVIGIIESAADHLYRYHIRFSDGRSATFFAFDLQLDRTEGSVRDGDIATHPRAA
jgi:hypothetical protein